MRVGIGLGPSGAPQHQSSHYVYDVRSGVIVGAYHFVGADPKSESERKTKMLESSHKASGISVEHLGVLSNPDIPPGEGELHVEHTKRQLVRKRPSYNPRIRS
jgi:hypothetical protein